MMAALLGVVALGLVLYVIRLRRQRNHAATLLGQMSSKLLSEWLYAEQLRAQLNRQTEDELAPKARTVVLKPGFLGEGADDIRA